MTEGVCAASFPSLLEETFSEVYKRDPLCLAAHFLRAEKEAEAQKDVPNLNNFFLPSFNQYLKYILRARH